MNKPVHYLAAAMLTLTSVVALAHDYTLGSPKIDHPCTRATPGGA